MKKTLFVLSYSFSLLLGISGCSATHTIAAIPKEDANNTLFIIADKEIGYSPYTVGDSLKENYKYTFGIAATATIDNGFKFFSIVDPKQLIKQYKDRNVTTAKEAYTACMEGDGSFHTTFSLSWMGEDEIPNCQNIVYMFTEQVGIKTAEHRVVRYYIEMHNDDRQDYVTFNAQDVLDSKFIKALDSKYFKPVVYEE